LTAECRVRWCGYTTGGEVRYWKMPELSHLIQQGEGNSIVFSALRHSLRRKCLEFVNITTDLSKVTNSFDDVTGASFTFGSDKSRALMYSTKSLSEIGSSAYERGFEEVFIDVKEWIGWGENLRFIDEVDPDRLEDLRFGEVSDSNLGHDRDAHRRFDLFDHFGVAHASDSTVAADVKWNALKSHNRDRSGVLSDASLLNIDDVHDHAVT
jgi:hypothetical protein